MSNEEQRREYGKSRYEQFDKEKWLLDLYDAVNYWYYKKKANVFPANYVTKCPIGDWGENQNKRVTQEQLEKWKKDRMFDRGFVVLLGKIHDQDKNLYLVCIDCDQKEAIDEIISLDIEANSIPLLSQKYRVEQHDDNPDSLHLYFLSPIPFASKPKDPLLGLDIRSTEKLLVVPAPNLHPKGHQWKILGITDPPILTTEQAKTWLSNLNSICRKHGLNYLNSEKTGKVDDRLKKMIKNLKIETKSNIRIYEGERHSKLVSIANFVLFTHLRSDGSNLEKLKYFFDEINETFCYPSQLPDKERNTIWSDAIEYVTKYKVSHHDNGYEDEKKTDWIESISEKVLEKYSFITLEETKEILYYEKGVYKYGGEILIEKEAEEIAGYDLFNHDLKEIKSHIMRRTYHKKTELDSNGDIINLSNGLYNWKENKLYPHSSDFLSIKQKPIFYDPKARPKLFGKFLSQVLYPKDIRTGIESMAYTFLPDCPFEYFFVLVGEGSNGKSVFTGILTALHSASNVSSVSIKSLLYDKFALADLEFKDVNVDEELSDSVLQDISILKKLTGGRKQSVRLERKYREAYSAHITSKLFFNANKIIQTTDQTNAFYRRLIMISFPNTFEEKDQDPNLLKKLTTQFELSGIFNLLMYYLRLIVKNGSLYLDEKSFAERRLKHERATDPVKSFLNEAITEDSTPDDYVVKTELYQIFVQYCNKHKLPIKSDIEFGRKMKKVSNILSGRLSTGERRNIWKGIRLKPEYHLNAYQLNVYQSY